LERAVKYFGNYTLGDIEEIYFVARRNLESVDYLS
jgi:hypothetical protein